MLQRPSLQNEYTLVFSGDPALDLPWLGITAGEDWTSERREELRAARERDLQRLRVARETGRWDEITLPGQQPTLFQIRPIHGPLLTWIQGYSQRAQLSTDEAVELALRVSLREVQNLGAFKLERAAIEGRTVVAESSMIELYAIGGELDPMLGRKVVLELGTLVLARAVEGVPPKS